MRKKYGSQMELPQNPDFEEIRQGLAMMEEQIESINKDVGLDMSTLRTAINGNELGFFRIGWYAEGMPEEEEPMSELKKAFSTDMRITNFDGTRMGAGGFLVERYKVVGLINAATAVDAVPVVHAARREVVVDGKPCWQCMACKMIHSGQTTGLLRYCSHCGARYTEVQHE